MNTQNSLGWNSWKLSLKLGSTLLILSFIQTQFNKTIKIIRSDNGVEFSMSSFYDSKGILHQKLCVETPQQNGVIVRKHQHILNIARSLMFPSHLPLSFWSFSVAHAVHILNMLSYKILKSKSPHFLLYNTNPNFQSLRVFGSLCFASIIPSHRTKFQSRAQKCIYLGHSFGTKGYLLHNLQARELLISRHVFYEMEWWMQNKETQTLLGIEN